MALNQTSGLFHPSKRKKSPVLLSPRQAEAVVVERKPDERLRRSEARTPPASSTAAPATALKHPEPAPSGTEGGLWDG